MVSSYINEDPSTENEDSSVEHWWFGRQITAPGSLTCKLAPVHRDSKGCVHAPAQRLFIHWESQFSGVFSAFFLHLSRLATFAILATPWLRNRSLREIDCGSTGIWTFQTVRISNEFHCFATVLRLICDCFATNLGLLWRSDNGRRGAA